MRTCVGIWRVCRSLPERIPTYTELANLFAAIRVGVAAAIIIAIAQQVSFITTIWEIRDKVPEPLATGAVVDVRPELVSLTCLALALLVGAVYVSRAQALRAASSMVGGATFSVS